jgi:multimeric flavodoxin WrbA
LSHSDVAAVESLEVGPSAIGKWQKAILDMGKEGKMKVLGILGSPRIGGNSDILLDQALAGARDAGAEVEKVHLSQKKISGCLDCTECNETGVCAIQDDMQGIYPKVLEADAILHSVPVYFWAMTAQMKAYLDRWCAFFDAEWKWHKHYYPRMKGKRIGLITVCGDTQVHTADPIVHSFKTTAEFTKLKWVGAVMASAAATGEIVKNEKSKKEAYELGKKAAGK